MRKSYEAVVIGGGIVGCCTAAELARAGVQVLLLERAELASAASGRNHGLIFYPQNDVTGDLYRLSHEMYRELAASSELDIALDDRPRGLLIVVKDEKEWAAAEAEAKASQAGGIDVTRLDEFELRAEERNLAHSLLGGYLIDDSYRLDPASLALAFALEARRAGAEVRTHTDVKQILTRNGRARGVATDDGTVEAEIVVDAAGPWAAKLARTVDVDLPITGARGWLLLTRAFEEQVAGHLIESAGWHLLGGDPGPAEVTVGDYSRGDLPRSSDVGLLVQQNRSGHILLGGSRLFSMREDPEGVEVTKEIARRAGETLPVLSEARIAAVWSGVRPMSRDGVPLIGPLDAIDGLIVAGGHGGQGVMLAGGTGRLVAQMLTGADPAVDPKPFRPDRFATVGAGPAGP
jgi:glycine/D-amino acid oxidase-like deaminating enzyme